MKKFIWLPILLLPLVGNANYLVTIPLDARSINFISATAPTVPDEVWSVTDPSYSDWSNIGPYYGCSNWTPLSSTFTESTSFTQNAADCTVNQERTVQDREISDKGNIRNTGSAIVQEQTLTTQMTNRNYTIVLSDWISSGAASCSTWSPDVSKKTNGRAFTQDGSNCTQNQTRTRNESYTDLNNTIVNLAQTNENKIVPIANYTRSATGTGFAATQAYNYTGDNFWVRGFAVSIAAFMLENNEMNTESYLPGRSVRLSTGEVRKIQEVHQGATYIDIILEGAPIDGNTVGYPNPIQLL